MNRKQNRIVFASAILFAAFTANVLLGADVTLLHSFAGGANDGSNPSQGKIVVDGSTLYGKTWYGGAGGRGTIFRINTDGSGFGVMHSFAGSDGDGGNLAGLTLFDSNLYGTSYYGGTYSVGNIYSVDLTGNNYTVLHTFSVSDGALPLTTLAFDGATMYGTTRVGSGTIYKMNSDGSNFSSVSPFSASNNDPINGLTICGTKMYGMTDYSGNSVPGGSLFRINTDLTGFEVLHTFTGGANDGKSPAAGALTLCGSSLYGTTDAGGAYGLGTIFKIDLDGSGFSVLHSFKSGEQFPGDLTVVGSSLYGTMGSGGDNGAGMIYKIDTDGSNYSVVHSFSSSDGKGRSPINSLTLCGSTLYGMTASGGQYGNGTVYSLQVPEPSTFLLLGFGVFGLAAWFRRRGRKAG